MCSYLSQNIGPKKLWRLCRNGKHGVQKIVTWSSVISFSSLMTKLHKCSGHWEALLVFILVLTALCELSKSQHNLKFTAELYINLTKTAVTFCLKTLFLSFFFSWQLATFWHKNFDSNEIRQNKTIRNKILMLLEPKFTSNKLSGWT